MSYLFLAIVAAMAIVIGACAIVAIGLRRSPDEINADNEAQEEYLRKYAQTRRASLREDV